MELVWITVGILLIWLLAMYYNAGWMSKSMVSNINSESAKNNKHKKNQDKFTCDCFENLTIQLTSKTHMERLLIDACFANNKYLIEATLERVYAVNKRIMEAVNISSSTESGSESLPYINGISKCISEYINNIQTEEEIERILVRWKANENSIVQSMKNICVQKDIENVLSGYRTSTINQISSIKENSYTSSYIAFDNTLSFMNQLYVVLNNSLTIVK